TTADPTKDKRWTQLFIPEVLCIPHQKPDVEQLLSVTSALNDTVLKYRGYYCDWKSRLRLKPFKTAD
ncbi:MAG TPA: hypothetical protein VMW91_02660, partial [Desulfosporosinus sp.]|nr:hypothetical protein [Desulfosporosinus sp.]